MCGVGDMLIACERVEDATLFGVEIDQEVYDKASQRLQHHKQCVLINDDAFSSQTLGQLNSSGYDLVITNPPYVRYQSLPGDLYITIRKNLLIAVDKLETLTDGEKQNYKILIEHFSGLSDLAVPSWLLCCLLVKPGGRIGMVLPETWLSRDYSFIVKYVLTKFFKIEFIVEDANSTWFHPAQVKTILLVAQRTRLKDLNAWSNETFYHINVYSKSFRHDSIVGVLESDPEIEFMKLISERQSVPEFFDIKDVKIKDFVRDIQAVCCDYPWYRMLESDVYKSANTELNALSELRSLIPANNLKLTTLPAIGVNVSQGLRTGANFFFYMDAEKVSADKFKVFPNESFFAEPFVIDAKFVKDVVRKQSDLDGGFSLSGFKTKGVVLTLQHFVTKEDYDYLMGLNENFSTSFEPMDSWLDRYVQAARSCKLPEKFKVDFIYNLSAVQPNVKNWSKDHPDLPPRFWYMLPEFSRRHAPDLFVPRINSSTTVTRINPKSRYLIDANFSTIWIDKNSIYDDYALLSLLNSTWCVVTMEEYGTVMGGGALKLEATQLKKIPIPVLSKGGIARLSDLGIVLAERPKNHTEIIEEIDAVIFGELGIADMDRSMSDLHALRARLLARRTKKKIYESIHSE